MIAGFMDPNCYIHTTRKDEWTIVAHLLKQLLSLLMIRRTEQKFTRIKLKRTEVALPVVPTQITHYMMIFYKYIHMYNLRVTQSLETVLFIM